MLHDENDSEFTDNDKYKLVSCKLNASQGALAVERIPIDTPKFIQEYRETEAADLHFLQWVFSGCFDNLSHILADKFPGYRVLRAECEPGISWEDYRSDRRNLLLWLIRIPQPDAHTIYAQMYNREENDLSSAQPSMPSLAGDAQLALSLIAQQMAKRKLNIRQFYKSLELSEARLDAMWSSLHHMLSLSPETQMPASTTNAGSATTANPFDYPTPTENRDGSEWSVVEDEDEDADDVVPQSASEEYESD